jgi:hypothetical protein
MLVYATRVGYSTYLERDLKVQVPLLLLRSLGVTSFVGIGCQV